MAKSKINFRDFNEAFQNESNCGEGDGYAIIDEHFKKSLAQINTTSREIDDALVELNKPVTVSMNEVNALLDEIRQEYDRSKLEKLIEDCQSQVLETIIRPFGLGRVLFEEKTGGNVTTIHNAQKGIYAADSDKYNRADYTHSKNSEGKSFAGSGKNSVGSSFTRKQLDKEAHLVDAYTGEREYASNTSPDHIVANSEFHKNGGFMLDKTRKADFSTDENNLASTRRDINQSLKDHDKMHWAQKKQGNRDVSNVEHFEIDSKMLKKAYKRGQNAAKNHAPSRADKAMYYGKNIAKTGMSAAGNMGLQQAIGVMLEEFVRATFEEIVDIWNNGIKNNINDSFFESLKIRLSKIALRVADKWRNAVDAFKDGAIAGFFSNFITVIINMFKTTVGKLERIIREGLMSLLGAIKLLLSPPEGMSIREAAHEASKLFTGGLIVAGGIMLEEAVQKSIISFLPFAAPFAPIVTTVLVGLATGLATVFSVYFLDKNDFFGTEKDNKHEFITAKLSAMIDESYARALESSELLAPC